MVDALRISEPQPQPTPCTFYRGAWRPAIGWLCVIGMGWQLFIQPFLAWVSPGLGIPPPPSTDLDLLVALVSTTLGIAGLRTVEKTKGI